MIKFKEGILIEIRAAVTDVWRYLETRLLQLPALRYTTDSLQLQEDIKFGILKAVDGMFLLAQLHLDSLAGKTSPKAIRTALKTLPTRSDAYDLAYKGAMERIEDQHLEHQVLARRVISWITYSKRPLTALELQHALAVEFGTRALDQDNFTAVDLMVSVCAGLVTADEESGMIRLIHYTTQEYFERTRNHWFPHAETEITKVCVTYLLFDVFGSSCQGYSDLRNLLAFNRLFDYAACNWGHHARMSSIQEDKLILDFLQSENNLSACTWAMVTSNHGRAHWYFPEALNGGRMAALHVTAYFGLGLSTAVFLKLKYNPSLKDGFDCTPLFYAAAEGYPDVMKLLLSGGADPNIRCIMARYPTAIHYAMVDGHLDVVELLLESNADPNIRGGPMGRTVLHDTAEKGYLQLAKLLLEKNANPDIQDAACGWTPLQYAVKNGDLKLAKLLLENNANPDLGNEHIKHGSTPLHQAAKNGSLELVELLLETNANPEIRGVADCRATPLHYAARNGHLELARLLLEKSADPNIQDCENYCLTPLHHATEKRHLEMVKLLLEKGADPSIQAKSIRCDWTPLNYATMIGHMKIVNMIYDGIADPDLQDKRTRYGSTPLHHAAMNGDLELMNLLLHNDASPNIEDLYGLTPLHCAAKKGNQDMVKLLLNWNANSTVRCHNGLTPLCYATQNGHHQVVDLLVSKLLAMINQIQNGQDCNYSSF